MTFYPAIYNYYWILIMVNHLYWGSLHFVLQGTSYYYVVQAGNIKGFGGKTNVKKCTPSHWADNKG